MPFELLGGNYGFIQPQQPMPPSNSPYPSSPYPNTQQQNQYQPMVNQNLPYGDPAGIGYQQSGPQTFPNPAANQTGQFAPANPYPNQFGHQGSGGASTYVPNTK